MGNDMITISLCMIVRNEEAILARCLDSLKQVVDEIIIVDTGSADRTKEIALQYTNNVYDFTWINDFAAARNHSFSKATMDYCMWADADDILTHREAKKLLQWKHDTKLSHAPDIVMLKYATSFHPDGAPAFLYYRERLIRRERGFLWKGRVHEAIPLSGNIEYLDFYLEHHSNKTSYSDRNLNIYKEMLANEDSFDARDWFYYARELYYHRKYADAVDGFSEFLKMPNGFLENKVEACRLAAYCCYLLHRPKRALAFLLKGLSYRVPSGELCCDLGKHFMDRNDYEQAVFWYLSALHTPKKTENGGFIQEECYDYLPCLQLSVCYDRLGQLDHAITYHKLAGSFQPTGELYLHNQPYFLEKEHELHPDTTF